MGVRYPLLCSRRCVLPSWGVVVTNSKSLARAASSLGTVTMGLPGTSLELGFRQCSFHHTMQVLRDHAFCAFSAPPAFPPCSVPLCLSTLGKAANLWNVPSISSLLRRDTVLTVVAHELSIHVIQWELALASVLENVQGRFGCEHSAYLFVLSMGNLPHFAIGLL